ncbi:MAG: hypothetical protein QM765_24865 [Myxococcales bacterium]
MHAQIVSSATTVPGTVLQLLALLAGQDLLGLGVQVLLDGLVERLMGERLAGDVGGAVRLAAPALGAAVDVEGLLPGEVGGLGQPEALRVLQVELGELPRRRQAREVDVEERGDDVEVLAVGQEVAEHQDDGDVDPVAGVHQHLEGAAVEADEPAGGRGADRQHRVEALVLDGQLRALEEGVADHQRGDEAEDEVGLPALRHPVGPLEGAQHDEVRRGDEGDGEDDVLEEEVAAADGGLVREQGQVEGRREAHPEEGDRPQREHQEREEDERVHRARQTLLGVEQPLLAEAELEQRDHPLAQVVEAVGLLQAGQQPQAVLHREDEERTGQDEQDGDGDGAHGLSSGEGLLRN